MSLLISIYYNYTIIICSNPYSSFAVFKESSGTCQTVTCIHSLKVRTVISDYSAVATNPHMAILCAKQEHRITGRHTIRSIIYLRSISNLRQLSGNRISASILRIYYFSVITFFRIISCREYIKTRNR